MTHEPTSADLDSLDPAPVWRLFRDIAAVPRASKSEQRIRAHVRAFADRHGLPCREDATGNVTIEVAPTPGHESAPITVLQGHLDMVCEKNAGTTHDFDRDPIHLERTSHDGEDVIRARGTTLGADNGIGVAMALAAATERDVVRGPLELLFTVDEEAGMTGAKALTPESFRGRRLLNLDSEEDDAIYIGCAGGVDTSLSWTLKASAPDGGAETGRVHVSGLRGGHSGGDIHENRANANKLLAAVLLRAGIDALRVGAMSGGSKRNAIAREAWACVSGPPGSLDALRARAAEVAGQAAADSAEPSPAVSVEPLPLADAGPMMTPADTRRILSAVAALPHGVLGMSRDVPGLVETSNNVATLHADAADGEALNVHVGLLSRGSSPSWMRVTCEQIAAVGRLAGAAVEHGNAYPGWKPNVDSPTLATCRRIYESLFGEQPRIAAIHAGLECGIIGERVGTMDMVSFGPHIEGAHSPDERIYISSVAKSWKYLKAVLTELAKG